MEGGCGQAQGVVGSARAGKASLLFLLVRPSEVAGDDLQDLKAFGI